MVLFFSFEFRLYYLLSNQLLKFMKFVQSIIIVKHQDIKFSESLYFKWVFSKFSHFSVIIGEHL